MPFTVRCIDPGGVPGPIAQHGDCLGRGPDGNIKGGAMSGFAHGDRDMAATLVHPQPCATSEDRVSQEET